jgi:hypothetical protein
LVSVTALVFKPAEFEADWEKTDVWTTSQRIAGVNVLCDEDGMEARRFGIKTSGHVLLYDSEGQLLYSGGITSARGHVGDNLGRNTIVSLLEGGTADCTDAVVFGCPFADPPLETKE